ncbi:MAG: PTS mannose transporter subunit IID [Halobacteriales archaeon SW_8_66_22]|jgi:dihydroxyacetone kinase phosphotransfer subunit|nr:MAG: PTS mannose transporter subunit IID [Halobacteriales archaeon SW_8_66_22]
MVGIVVVSHSERAADGVAEVATEMGGDAGIVPAGGGPDGGIGTLAPDIEAAIREADDGDGVVVLVDLGSAVMNAEIAIEAVEDETDARIADAPILEGALNAAVAAASGDTTVETVLEKAEEAREYRKLD